MNKFVKDQLEVEYNNLVMDGKDDIDLTIKRIERLEKAQEREEQKRRYYEERHQKRKEQKVRLGLEIASVLIAAAGVGVTISQGKRFDRMFLQTLEFEKTGTFTTTAHRELMKRFK